MEGFCSSCGLTPSFLVDWLGQLDPADEFECDLCAIVHRDLIHDLTEEFFVECACGDVLAHDLVKASEIVESITVDDSTQITFKLIGGIELTEPINEKGRCKTA